MKPMVNGRSARLAIKTSSGGMLTALLITKLGLLPPVAASTMCFMYGVMQKKASAFNVRLMLWLWLKAITGTVDGAARFSM